MMRSMFAGVAGLQNHQTQMDVIGNNIANVNTIGFKGSRVTFQDTLSQVLRGASAPGTDRGGINALQVGLGMNIASIDILQTQGNLKNTGNMTDVALQGDGFFIVGSGQQQYYTRAGNFQMEENGRLVFPSNGLGLQGWVADNSGAINPNTPVQGIKLPIGQTIPPVATTKVGFQGTLDSKTNGTLAYSSLNVTDGFGHNPTVEIKLTPIGFNQYQYTANVINGTITSGSGTGIITLDNDGNVIGTGTDFAVTPSGTGAQPITIHVPQLNATTGGSFTSDKTSTESWQLSTLDFSPAATFPQTFTTTTKDDMGNAVNLQYTVNRVSGDQYSYTVSVPDGTGTVLSGATGTFTNTPTEGTSNGAIDGGLTKTVIRSAGTPPLEIAIAPPATAPGSPSFSVLTKEGPFAGRFAAAQPLTTTTKIYDSLGTEHTIITTVKKNDNNSWNWVCTDEAANNIGSGTLSFSNTGSLVSTTGGPLVYMPTGANPMNITPDFTKVTQYAAAASEITSPEQDGFPMGQLQTFNIDKSGKVVGVFSNGMSQTLAQIAVANFTNPGGLMRSGESLFQSSANSGTAQIGQAGQSGRGLITPGAVEMSNVNLSLEFTEMIVTERGFQANSKIITTSDEMLQDLVNLKR